MNKLALVALAIAAVSATKDYGDYGDYMTDSSSISVPEIPVRPTPGDYYICIPADDWGNPRRCLTYKEAPQPDESSDSSECNGKGAASSDSSVYVEKDRYRYVYASPKYASKFTISCENATSSVFTVACESCKNEHHNSLVSVVRHHLELQSTDPKKQYPVGKFTAWRVDEENNLFHVKHHGVLFFHRWWQVSTFRQRMKLDLQAFAAKVGFFTDPKGEPVDFA